MSPSLSWWVEAIIFQSEATNGSMGWLDVNGFVS